MFKAKWLNADDIRKNTRLGLLFKGRIRQAKRLSH